MIYIYRYELVMVSAWKTALSMVFSIVTDCVIFFLYHILVYIFYTDFIIISISYKTSLYKAQLYLLSRWKDFKYISVSSFQFLMPCGVNWGIRSHTVRSGGRGPSSSCCGMCVDEMLMCLSYS